MDKEKELIDALKELVEADRACNEADLRRASASVAVLGLVARTTGHDVVMLDDGTCWIVEMVARKEKEWAYRELLVHPAGFHLKVLPS